MSQLDLLAALPDPLCRYGTPLPGDPNRPCHEPATHRARAHKPATHLDGTPNPNGPHDASIDCCLDHANYYATAWTPAYPGETGSAWLEILTPGRPIQRWPGGPRSAGGWTWEPLT